MGQLKTNKLPPELVEKMKQGISFEARNIDPFSPSKCAQIAVRYSDENCKVLEYQKQLLSDAYEKAKQQRDELLSAMREFTNAIESEEITIQENFDNDGWESCGSRLYETFKKLINKIDGKE